MRPDPTILAFDTSAAHCAAALLSDDVIRAERHEALARGQAERLMPMLEEMLAEAGKQWADLDAVAVGVGPGNFTGIRISVAAARGLGLALRVPVIGVSSFEIMRGLDAGLQEANELVSVAAPRGQAYVQHLRKGTPQDQPRLIEVANPPQDIRLPVNMVVTGYRADEIAAKFNARANPTEMQDIGACIARRAEWRLVFDKEVPERPTPLYVRAPDAAPPKLDAPVILNG